MYNIWTKSTEHRYTAEASTLSVNVDIDKCPKCGKEFGVQHRVDTVRTTEDEVVKWVYQHDCGVALVIFND